MNKSILPWKKGDRLPTRTMESDNTFEELRQRMNRLFEDFFDDDGFGALAGPLRGGAFQRAPSPSFEVSETDDRILVTAELPGMDEKDVDVTLANDVLTVKGEKREEREEKDGNIYLSERSYGSFQRVLPLSSAVDQAKVKASFKKGVLTITLPKTAQARDRGHKIDISAD